jgi:hypothetical protein
MSTVLTEHEVELASKRLAQAFLAGREPIPAVEMATEPGFPENSRNIILNHAIHAATFAAATEDVEALAATSDAAREEVAARRTASRRPRSG